MPTLERITPANALTYKAVRLAALQDSPGAFGSTYAQESQRPDADWLRRAGNLTGERSVGYLAMDAGTPGTSGTSGTPCGIAAGYLDEHDPMTAHLVSMWVAPDRRRSGVGRLLVDAVAAWAVDRRARTLQLMVTSSNLAAIEFYKRNGFAMTGNTEPYPNDPALIEYEMSRPLVVL